MPGQPKIHMVRALSRAPGPLEFPIGVRAMCREDIPCLGRLFLAAYDGTVDYEGESEHEAIAAVQSTFDGEFGEFLESASAVVEHSGKPVSASFVTLWQGRPLLAFSVTAPQHKGTGLAGRCIAGSMQVLGQSGYRELHLYVTAGNAPALSVYRRLGFVAESPA